MDEYHELWANHSSKEDCPACAYYSNGVTLPKDVSVMHILFKRCHTAKGCKRDAL